MSMIVRYALLAAAAVSPAVALGKTIPPPADPLTVGIRTEDADRFARLFAEAKGRPTAEQLQRGYLNPGSYGIEVFTPNRIRSAEALAAKIAQKPEAYRVAIEKCLPVVKQANSELRAIYLGLRGLFPTRPLPQIYVVFGGGNSGGTAGPSAQVLGLEVLCAVAPTPEKLRQTLRMFFAHETVHSWQQDNVSSKSNPLLRAVLKEGAADFIASLVLGVPPNLEREDWARGREAELWKQFEADVATTRGFDWDSAKGASPELTAIKRWVGNYSQAPEGWPYEMGYWTGMRIWQRYMDTAPDKHKALEEVLTWTDPEAVLAKGAYRP